MAPLKKPKGNNWGDVDRAWDCPSCGTPLAVASYGLDCLKCGQVQKRLLSVEEASTILKTILELFDKRVRLDAEGRVCEEFIDLKDLVKAWKAIEQANLLTGRPKNAIRGLKDCIPAWD